jgi:hypothetical protein
VACRAERGSEPGAAGAYLLFAMLSRLQDNLRKHELDAKDLPDRLQGLDQMQAALRHIAQQDGYQLKRPPGRPRLFKSYLETPGYSLFWTLSEIAAHPGTVHMVVFHRDSETRTVNVNLEGAHVERCYWSAMAVDLLGRTCDVAVEVFGWHVWREKTALPLIRKAIPDLKEAVRRWADRWDIPFPGVELRE